VQGAQDLSVAPQQSGDEQGEQDDRQRFGDDEHDHGRYLGIG
jgi:hypothetical protein